jgi:type IX secretion system substrate protein
MSISSQRKKVYFRFMKKIILLYIIFISAGNCFAQQVTFQKTYGGADHDYGQSVQQTSDGGYIITGTTPSFSAIAYDVYLIKTDSIGDTLWTKIFGGGWNDRGISIYQTADGGYIITGFTESFGAGYRDVYLIKTDFNGNILWTKTFGGVSPDVGNSVQQTTDGGYIIVSANSSFGLGLNDVYLIKTDSTGDTLWTKNFGGTGNDFGYSVQQTADGGYIIAGSTGSYGAGNGDIYLVKTYVTGNPQWAKTYGGTDHELANSVRQTSDGGYIIIGTTISFGTGDNDIYLIKTDASGDSLWTKTFGGADDDYGYFVQQTTDGGYIISGGTYSFGGSDLYLIKTNANGNLTWSKIFDGTVAYNNSVCQTTDGGYIIGGTSNSSGAGYHDICLIKTDANGNSGCNQGSPATIVLSTATQITSPATMVSSGGTITNPAAIIGSGATVTTLCTNVGLSPTPALPGGERVAIAPNPSQGNFVITFPNTIHKGSIEIYTVLEKKIFEENIFSISQKEIHLKNSVAGIYFVKVRDGEKEYGEKLVIE